MPNNPFPVILSIESSATTCGVALCQGTTLLGELSVSTPHSHDRLLSSFCSDILVQTGVEFGEIDAVAVSAGPGSFTGLRIGSSLAKALCFTDTPRLIGVPTLRALATAAEKFALAVAAQQIVAAVPSHKNLLYSQSFAMPHITPLTAPTLHTVEEFTANTPKNAVYCGPATSELTLPGFALSEFNHLTPRFIAHLALRMFREEHFTPAAAFTPLYVQEFAPKVSPPA